VIYMQTTLAKPKPRAVIVAAAAFPSSTRPCNLLEKCVPQEREGNERELIKVAASPRVALLEDGFLRFHQNAMRKFGPRLSNDAGNTRQVWDDFQNFAIEINVTPSELEEFTLRMGKFERMSQFELTMGIYLSMLIHDSKHNGFRLQLEHLGKRLDQLCWNCNKSVVVRGDVGSEFCVAMHQARVVLHGNAGFFAGYMLGAGLLFIVGDVGLNLGQGKSGGRIIVWGNAGCGIGTQMSGGEITVNGSCNGAGELMFGGKITINGDAGEEAGANMNGGTLIVNGTWGKDVCKEIRKGTVYLNGTGAKLGGWFGRPDIYLNGKQIYQDGSHV